LQEKKWSKRLISKIHNWMDKEDSQTIRQKIQKIFWISSFYSCSRYLLQIVEKIWRIWLICYTRRVEIWSVWAFRTWSKENNNLITRQVCKMTMSFRNCSCKSDLLLISFVIGSFSIITYFLFFSSKCIKWWDEFRSFLGLLQFHIDSNSINLFVFIKSLL